MFRTPQNAFDELVARATDENLTSENWELIMDVCDRVSTEDSGAKDAVQALIKRLGHRNANVQLYTLELGNALSQNCGSKMHRELASRSFTDALLRLANDRNTHQQVKSKVLERMEEWTEMFSNNTDLGIMEQAYMKLKSQNPNLQPPTKPTKREITDIDRRKEEEELQMALALSLRDKNPTQPSSSMTATAKTTVTSSIPQAELPADDIPVQSVSSGTTAATVSRVRALYDFQPSEPGELQFRKGDIIAVLESVYKDWWKGSLRGQTGIFPLNYVEKLQDPTEQELRREAQMEAEVFAQIKNVEKLLTLLSTSSSDLNVRDNEEITQLYSSTVAIRPKLIELIGKYSQKKDDFTQLNEKFIKARRDYEALLESSMAQPPPSFQWNRQSPSYAYPSTAQPQAYPPMDPTQRYFSPRPQDDSQNPARTTPAPFYVVGSAAVPSQINHGVSSQPSAPALANVYAQQPSDRRQHRLSQAGLASAQEGYGSSMHVQSHQGRQSSGYVGEAPQELSAHDQTSPVMEQHQPTSYSTQQQVHTPAAPDYGQAGFSQAPSHAPPGVPTAASPGLSTGVYPSLGHGSSYQAYTPRRREVSGGDVAAGDDGSDFYR